MVVDGVHFGPLFFCEEILVEELLLCWYNAVIGEGPLLGCRSESYYLTYSSSDISPYVSGGARDLSVDGSEEGLRGESFGRVAGDSSLKDKTSIS